MKDNFSHEIKKEIIEYKWSQDEWDILFYSFLRANGTFKNGVYHIKTTFVEFVPFIKKLFKEIYKLDVKYSRTKTLYKFNIGDPSFLEFFTKEIGNKIIETESQLKAYIAGAFIGKGWINSPNSRFYHCEIRLNNLSHSLDLQEVFEGLGLHTSTLQKNKWYYTYIKKSTDIAKFISIINAHQSLMKFEDARIERDFIATYRKMESIENFNLNKTQKASTKQLKAIEILESNMALNKLRTELYNICILRKKNPNYSLVELQMEFNKIYDVEISKSTINLWLNKILEYAENISKGSV